MAYNILEYLYSMSSVMIILFLHILQTFQERTDLERSYPGPIKFTDCNFNR